MYRPKLYTKANELQQKENELTLAEYKDVFNWKGRDSLLDIGCGPGDNTIKRIHPLLPANYSLLMGVDVSQEMVTYASMTYGATVPKTRFQQLDISKPLVDKSLMELFDNVTSFIVFHYFKDQRYKKHLNLKTLSLKNLKKGGVSYHFYQSSSV